MSTINVVESLRKIDNDTCNKYNLLTMYEACNLNDEEKGSIAKMISDNESPEALQQKLNLYFDSDDISDIDAFGDFITQGKFYDMIDEVVKDMTNNFDTISFDKNKNTLHITKDDSELELSIIPENNDELEDYAFYLDKNYSEPHVFSNIDDAKSDIITFTENFVKDKCENCIDIDECNDDMAYKVYDVFEDTNGMVTAKCVHESTNTYTDIDLGKIGGTKITKKINDILNSPNFKIDDENKKKLGSYIGMTFNAVPALIPDDAKFDSGDGLNHLFGDADGSIGDVGVADGGAMGESIKKEFFEGERVQCKKTGAVGTVIEADVEMVLVDWDAAEIKWVPKDQIKVINNQIQESIDSDELEDYLYTIANGNADSIPDYDDDVLDYDDEVTDLLKMYDINSKSGMGYCPVCGGTRFNTNRGFCLDCGYNEGDWGYTNTDDYDDLDESYEDGWAEEDINLHKSIDWKSRNYMDFPVTTDSFVGEAILYGEGKDKLKNVKMIKYLVANPVYPPYYAPKENPFKEYSNVVGPMYDGRKHGPYQIHDRYETQELYDTIFESAVNNDKSFDSNNVFEIGDMFEFTGLYGGSYDCKIVGRNNNVVTVNQTWISEDTGKEISKTTKYDVHTDDEGEYIIIWQYRDEEGKVYAHNTVSLTDSFYTESKLMSDDCELVEDLAPYKKEEFKKQLQDELYDRMIKLFYTPEWGYENIKEINDFINPIIEIEDYKGDYDNDIKVELRAELNYPELEEVCTTLDKVIQKYDKQAYFEPVTSGIADAYMKFPKKLESFTESEILSHCSNTWEELIKFIESSGYEVDSINRRNPSQWITAYKDDNEYEIEINKYFDGTYEVIKADLVGSITEANDYIKESEDYPEVNIHFVNDRKNGLVGISNERALAKVFNKTGLDKFKTKLFNLKNVSIGDIKDTFGGTYFQRYYGWTAFTDDNYLYVTKVPLHEDFEDSEDEYDDEELQDIIDELTADGFDVTDEADLLMGLGADLGMDRADARYYAKLILNHMDDSNVKRKGKLITAINESYYTGSDLRQANLDALEYFIEFEDIYPFPKGEFLATDWKELRDGVAMGMDDDLEIAEGIMEYLQKEIDFNNKHKEIYEDDPQAELTLEIYNKVKREYEKEISKYESTNYKKCDMKESTNHDYDEEFYSLVDKLGSSANECGAHADDFKGNVTKNGFSIVFNSAVDKKDAKSFLRNIEKSIEKSLSETRFSEWIDTRIYRLTDEQVKRTVPQELADKILNTVIVYEIQVDGRCMEDLNEASYGGAFDIEDDQYFTKEEIIEVAEKVCEHLDETYPDKFDVSDVYMETPTVIHVEVISKEGNWASANAKIDMRKIKKPSDIMKYDVIIGDLVYNLRQELEELYKHDSLKEDLDPSIKDPQEDDSWSKASQSQETIYLTLDDVIVDVTDDSWDYSNINWAANEDDDKGEWYSEDGVYIGDDVLMSEYFDELIEEHLPEESGKYKLSCDAELAFDINGIEVKRDYFTTKDGYDYDEEKYVEDAEATFNRKDSKVFNIKFTTID